MKRNILLAVALGCAFSLAACGGGGTEKDALRIEKIVGRNAYQVTGVSSDADTIAIPSEYLGAPVVKIATGAFANSAVKELTIPQSVNDFALDAFAGVSGLTLRYEGSTSDWCACSFENGAANPLHATDEFWLDGRLATQINIPDDVLSIGEWSFYGYEHLYSVTVAESVESVGEGAFAGCLRLVEVANYSAAFTVSLSSNANGKIASNAIAVYNAETAEEPFDSGLLDDGEFVTYLKSNGTESLVEWRGISGKVTLPDYLDEVNAYALKGATMSELTIPSNVLAVGKGAFENAVSLKKVVVSSGVENIGRDAFKGCSALTQAVFADTSWFVKADGEGWIAVEDVFDSKKAATYLTSTYLSYEWMS